MHVQRVVLEFVIRKGQRPLDELVRLCGSPEIITKADRITVQTVLKENTNHH